MSSYSVACISLNYLFTIAWVLQAPVIVTSVTDRMSESGYVTVVTQALYKRAGDNLQVNRNVYRSFKYRVQCILYSLYSNAAMDKIIYLLQYYIVLYFTLHTVGFVVFSFFSFSIICDER